MTKMAATHHLKRRNGVWYYRRRIPEHLVEAFGKRVIQISLNTSDLKDAKRRREVLDLEWSAKFNGAEHSPQLSPAHNEAPDHWAPGQLLRLVQDYVARTDERYRDQAANDPPDTEEQKRGIEMDIEMELDIISNRDDPRQMAMVGHAFDRILKEAGIAPEKVGHAQSALAEWVRRALIELDKRRLARIKDDHSRTHFDQVFDPGQKPQVRFDALATQYLALVTEDATANGSSQKWIDKQSACVSLIREIVGAETPLNAVDYDKCLEVRSTLARVPANRAKFYGPLALELAIARGEKEGRSTLSSLSQKVYLATFKGILNLAAKKGLIGINPAHDLTPLKKDLVAAADKREPFTTEQIVQFFNCEFYKSCATSPVPYRHDKTGWRFWLPLICLFTGMRPNEVCQLTPDDVRQTKSGTWYFDVTTSDDENQKTLKTTASRRRVPIHPELIAIGMLAFATEGRAQKASRLFEIKPDKYGNLATYPLKRFRDQFLPQAITVTDRQSFYSFRHNFRDALRRIGAPADALQALGGWSQGKLVSDDYGDKANPDYQSQWIAKVSFPGLDLSHLRVNS